MLSLTDCLKIAEKTQRHDFFCTDHVVFPLPESMPIVNPYPDSLAERGLWGLMGTFTDYMIRKMFRDREISEDARVVPEDELVCERALDLMPDLIASAAQVNRTTAITFSGQGDEWIARYKSESWDQCIGITFLICQLDSLYRAGKLARFLFLSRKEERMMREFCGSVLAWLRREFKDAQLVVLNPVLGHPDICKADGDLVIDDTLYDIKTVKRPEAEINRSKNQLLGYAALAHYHSLHPVATSPKCEEPISVGYIFPMSLRQYSVSITDFTETDRLAFIEKLKQVQNLHQSPPAREPLTKVSRFFVDFNKIMVLMERGAALLRDKQYEKAEELFRKVLVIAPSYNPAAYHLCEAILATRGLEAAESFLDESIQDSSDAAFAQKLGAIRNYLLSQRHL